MMSNVPAPAEVQGTQQQPLNPGIVQGGLPLHHPAGAPPGPPPGHLRGGQDVYKVEWTGEEQSALENGLASFSPKDFPNPVERYAKIKATYKLQRKSIRDIALRKKWLEDHAVERKKRVEDAAAKAGTSKAPRRDRTQSIFATAPKGGMPMPGMPMHGGPLCPMPLGTALGTPVGTMAGAPLLGQPLVGGHMMLGPTHYMAHLPHALHMRPMQALPPNVEDPEVLGDRGSRDIAQLFEDNLGVLQHIKANMQAFHIDANTPLLMRLYTNLRKIQELCNQNPSMKEMEPLPIDIRPEAEKFLSENLNQQGSLPRNSPVTNAIPGMVSAISYYPQQPSQPPQSQLLRAGPVQAVAHSSAGPVPTAAVPRVSPVDPVPYVVPHQPAVDSSAAEPEAESKPAVRGPAGPSPAGPAPAGPGLVVPKVEDVKPAVGPVPPVNGTMEARGPPPAGSPQAPAETLSPAAPLRGGLRPNRSKPAGIRQSARSGK